MLGSVCGQRKRLQVESFRAIIQAAGAAGAGGSRGGELEQHDGDGAWDGVVVDFGSGTGNLILPLAAAMPRTQFVGLVGTDK